MSLPESSTVFSSLESLQGTGGTLELRLDGGVLYVLLNRPEVHNAMNLAMVSELGAVLDHIEPRDDVRIVVLRGAGGTFCAGGDVKEMRADRRAPESQRRQLFEETSRAFGHMLARFDRLPKTVIAAVEGPVLGGGFGLVCVSDVALATDNASFALPETAIGLVPAQIAPFVIRRIGLPQTRRLSLTAGALSSHEARDLGLVHAVCGADEFDRKLSETIQGALRCAPAAMAATKRLLLSIDERDPARSIDKAARVFTDAALGDEVESGIQALLEKRPPKWMTP